MFCEENYIRNLHYEEELIEKKAYIYIVKQILVGIELKKRKCEKAKEMFLNMKLSNLNILALQNYSFPVKS